MRKKRNTADEIDDGSYVVKKSRKSNVLAFVVCVLVAFVIWAYAVTKEQKLSEVATEHTAVICAEATEQVVSL